MSSTPRPIILRIDYVFHYASACLLLTWVSLVVKTRIYELADSDSVRGDVNIIPTLSDSTRHPTQHPFAAAIVALTVYQIWFANFILLAVAFDRDIEKKRAAWISFALNTVFAIFIGLSFCVFTDTTLHVVFAALACASLVLWMCWVSFRPPFPEKKVFVVGCWVSTIVSFLSGIFFLVGFTADLVTMVAISEYIIVTALSVILSLIAVGGRGTKVFLHVNAAVTGGKEDERDSNDSETDRAVSQKNGTTSWDSNDMSESLSTLDLAVESQV